MQAISRPASPTGRRLAGAALYALLVMGIVMPILIGIAGLIVGPQPLREQIIITASRFGAYHGSAGFYLVMLAGFVLITLYNVVVGPRTRYAWNWKVIPPLFDDAVSVREKLALLLTNNWARLLLVLDVVWIVLAAAA
jgi:hypothetical protein